jgi:hypothetical protein
MFMRRRFQPTFDGLCSRIAPSSVAIVAPPALLAGNVSQRASAPVATAFDTDMPQTGKLSPIILAPPPTTPSPTLSC